MSTLTHRIVRPADTDDGIHDPGVEIRIGAAVIGVFLFGFIGWSAMARLDAAVHMPGVVRIAGNHQAVQSVAGGVITAVDVHEGDRVRAGMVLVEFAATEALAEERSLASRVIGLEAEIARIEAEQASASSVAEPIAWAALDGVEREEAQRALAGEQANLVAGRSLVASERAVLRERIAQVSDQIGGYHERQSSNLRQGELNKDELEGVQQLYRKGYATRTRVLDLQRSAAAIDGELGATQAEIARLRTSAGETRMQMMQLADQRDHDNTDRLRTARTELDTLLPQWKAARDAVARSTARAPVAGTVLGLAANSVGGVVSAGQRLMDIVPASGTLEIEAQVALADANDLHAGQKADVRVEGLRGRNLPPMHGMVRRVSPDSLTDDHSGRTYFTAAISVPRAELDRIGRQAEIAGSIRPGTPVDVTIPLRARTALQYWVGPITDRMRPALHEE